MPRDDPTSRILSFHPFFSSRLCHLSSPLALPCSYNITRSLIEAVSNSNSRSPLEFAYLPSRLCRIPLTDVPAINCKLGVTRWPRWPHGLLRLLHLMNRHTCQLIHQSELSLNFSTYSIVRRLFLYYLIFYSSILGLTESSSPRECCLLTRNGFGRLLRSAHSFAEYRCTLRLRRTAAEKKCFLKMILGNLGEHSSLWNFTVSWTSLFGFHCETVYKMHLLITLQESRRHLCC